MATADTWSRATNILCVRLDALGDVLMTTPAIRALKGSCPGRRITLLSSAAGAAVAPFVPEIDDWIVYDAPWLKATAPRTSARPDDAMIERLRRTGFDAAVIFTVYSQNPLPSAFLCYLADIPLRLAHCHENPYQLLTHWVPDPDRVAGPPLAQGAVPFGGPGPAVLRHEVRRQLNLVATVGSRTGDERMSFRVPAAARRRAGRVLGDLGVDRRRPWVLVHPGATAPSRRYPPDGFAAAARRLALDAGCQVIFTGSAPERDLVEEIRAAMGVVAHSLAGRLELAELAALIEQAPVLIANNTGPVHIAAAVGTPVVDLYALTNPQHTPWGVPSRVLFHDVPCKYCYKSICPEGHHRCLRLVSPDSIVAAARELLGLAGEGPGAPLTWSLDPGALPHGYAWHQRGLP